ncbi:glycosyltransferase family 2 protein [Lepidopterella palustris CBS 459.81]|uniref:Glycosyltransferase family 2 protein n=1 Tax=Lepidopterella palustris CBS 459.81 TaxID=1314670 RepID=A0A8E2DWA4_9PEZI|nr:glycosyltransferase family 2 protein [Lepidopterella palustris CBS 459.81]
MSFPLPFELCWSWIWVYWLSFLFRYLRLWVNNAANILYTPIPPPEYPSVTSQDLTVVIPTVAGDIPQLKETVQTAMQLDVFEIFLVTTEACLKRVLQMVVEMGSPKIIRVLSVPQANKRLQMAEAFPEVRTKLTLLLDDDVWLPRNFAKWILAPFENPRCGGVGTNQVLRRKDPSNVWEFLGSIYLVRRTFDCTACNWIDGGLPCLSGRAVAYRSEILQTNQFRDGFRNERWRNNHILNADDDNFITRWLFTHKWSIKIQNHRECEVETVLESDSKYLKQCLRWVRSNWRSNWRSLCDPYTWKTYPWTTYAVFQTTLTQWAFPYDLWLCASFHKMLLELGYYSNEHGQLPYILWGIFLAHCFIFSKTVKLIPHFTRYPSDIKFLPVSILFGYFHNYIKFQGLRSLNETTWGTREGADTDDNLRMIPLVQSPKSMEEGRVLRERGTIIPTAIS